MYPVNSSIFLLYQSPYVDYLKCYLLVIETASIVLKIVENHHLAPFSDRLTLFASSIVAARELNFSTDIYIFISIIMSSTHKYKHFRLFVSDVE